MNNEHLAWREVLSGLLTALFGEAPEGPGDFGFPHDVTIDGELSTIPRSDEDIFWMCRLTETNLSRST
jgi:hypothetical protein